MTSSPARLPAVLDGVIGQSRALYTNWLYVKPLKLQIDAGDGAAIGLDRFVGSPRVLALTHGHSDHILGLLNILGARQFGTLTSGGPLTIVYPSGCPRVAALQAFMAAMWSDVSFDRVSWVPMAPGGRFALDATRTLEAFATQHVEYLPSLGYAVREHRRRLTAAARALPVDELRARIQREGKGPLEEPYEHTLFAHTGDTMPVDSPLFEGADVLVYDTTFLDAADRDYPSHATLAEALAIATARQVKTLVVHHVSRRYERDSLLADIRHRIPPANARPAVVLWDDTSFTPV